MEVAAKWRSHKESGRREDSLRMRASVGWRLSGCAVRKVEVGRQGRLRRARRKATEAPRGKRKRGHGEANEVVQQERWSAKEVWVATRVLKQ